MHLKFAMVLRTSDSQVDEGVETPYYVDNDGDGYGDPNQIMMGCTVGNGLSSNADDCDDTDPLAWSSAPEVCDGVDNDCDGVVDGPNVTTTLTWYADGDADGYGDLNSTVSSCSPVQGYVLNADDCDDSSSIVFPGADEICNNLDDDCDAIVDNNPIDGTLYADVDGDSYGDANNTITSCLPVVGYVSVIKTVTIQSTVFILEHPRFVVIILIMIVTYKLMIVQEVTRYSEGLQCIDGDVWRFSSCDCSLILEEDCQDRGCSVGICNAVDPNDVCDLQVDCEIANVPMMPLILIFGIMYEPTKIVVDVSSATDDHTAEAELETRFDFDGDGNWDLDWSTTKSLMFDAAIF